MILIYALVWNWLYHALETSYEGKYEHDFFNITNSFVHPFYYIIHCMNWLLSYSWKNNAMYYNRWHGISYMHIVICHEDIITAWT
jgi:hypothetical protein